MRSDKPAADDTATVAADSYTYAERQAQRMELAYGIIQAIHGDLSFEKVADTIVENLVEIGGFVSARLAIDMVIGELVLKRTAAAGPPDLSGMLSRTIPVFLRGKEVGSLQVTCDSKQRSDEQFELLEWVLPTLIISLDSAVQFAEVSDYRATLEKRVEQRTAELAEARDSLQKTVVDLEDAQAVRSRIFANINHEIRTPLSLVMLAASEIRGRHQNKNDPKTLASVSNIETASERLLNMVDSMLLLAAGQEGKLRMRIRQSDLAMDVRRAVSIWQSHAKANNLTLAYSGPDRLNGAADAAALERILANLISNAIKYTPDGGRVEVGLTADDQHATIAVRDTGVGIDEDFKKRIFGRFEQGRAAVRPGSRSSGIGLSIVKELVEAHQGTVTADAAPGGGTIFTVRLPLQSAPAAHDETGGSVVPVHSIPIGFGVQAEAKPTTAILMPERAPLATLLIAEDDNGLRTSIGELLVAGGYKVLLAPDGFAALNLANEQFPDMLVSDVGMPGMDGLELSRRFRALPGNRLAPVLLLTAFGTMTDKLSGFEAGAIDYVTKPFEPRELLARVESQLRLREMALKLSQSEKLASLGTMSAGLAHEMRNPANGLLNAMEPLLELLPPEVVHPDTGSGQLLEVIRDCAQQIGRLSKQLLGFKNEGAVVCTVEDVQHLVKRAISMVDAKNAGVEIRVRHAYGGQVRCAGPMVLQVLVNLIDNAVQAAGRGGWVEVVTRVDGERACFDVIDSGSGVPKELRERIFEPFFTTKAPGAGTGLGLSTARQIVNRHDGSLRVVDGDRSTFTLELPLNGPNQGAVAVISTTAPLPKALS